MLPTVKLLVRLLLDQNAMVKCKAALALESIAITTPGKYSCLKEGAIGHLVPLIDESSSEARVNALKVICLTWKFICDYLLCLKILIFFSQGYYMFG